MRLAVALVVLSSLHAQAAAPEKHPFGFDDWAALRSAHAISVSPDGATILYGVHFGGAKGRTNDEWRTISVDGSGTKKLDLPADFTPAGFTPDGASLYGVYKINNLPQFAVFNLKSATAKATPAIAVLLPRGVHGAEPSPDGSKYALIADPRAPDELAETRIVIEPAQTSIYVVKSDGTGGQWWCSDLKDISAGPGSGAPAIAWSADNSSLTVLSTTPKIGNHFIRSYIDTCSASGSHRIAEIPNSADGLAWTNGGRDIAFVSTTNSVLTPDELYTVPAAGGKPVNRTPNLDATVTGVVSDPHGRTWVAINRGVQTEVSEFRDNALGPASKWADGFIAGPPVFSPYTAASTQLAFTVGDPTHASNVAVLQSSALHKITTEGDDQIAKVDLGPVHDVRWKSKEGIDLEGIATFPAGYSEGKKYPFLVLPHGGPEANDLLAFDAFSRMITGLGYVVLQPEYRGSTGRGDKFLDSIYQHFGDRAYRDVDSATDYAIAAAPISASLPIKAANSMNR